MKKRRITFYILISCFTTMLVAQNISIGHINTEIVLPLVVAEHDQLSFGKFVSTSNGGVIQISINNERTSSGDIQLMEESAGKSARFVVTGVHGALVSLSFPQTQCRLYYNGSYPMLVDGFYSNIPLSGKEIDLSTGRLEVSVGATLHVGNSKENPAGFYVGSYDVIFMYN